MLERTSASSVSTSADEPVKVKESVPSNVLDRCCCLGTVYRGLSRMTSTEAGVPAFAAPEGDFPGVNAVLDATAQPESKAVDSFVFESKTRQRSKLAIDEDSGGEGSATIRTQEEVCRRFLPILKQRGKLINKTGRRLARPAVMGEEVLTIINGVIMAKTLVGDTTSMVVRQESADNELYVLNAEKFAKNYSEKSKHIYETEPAFEELRQRGYKYYDRKGQLLIYRVTEQDIKFFRGGKLEVSFSSIPQPVQVGDYLVTVCPEHAEVYVSPHISIYNDDGQLSQVEGVRTQQDMCQYFIPILRDFGKVVKKSGRRLARPAKLGEEIMTVINGEMVAKTVVADDASMVIRQESADHELYVLDKDKFARNYEMPGIDIDVGKEPRLEELRDRGFKYYERIGELLIYKVTAKDMEFVPAGKFQVSFSLVPQPLREGDFLVTTLPEMKEVYMSRHAVIYNDDGQLYQPHGVCSQEEMRSHFLPIMHERGVRMRRAGRRLARPARKGEELLTIVNTEVVSKSIVQDETSMVVQEESADRELYVLTKKTFEECYDPTGIDITDTGHEAEALRARGFKYYNKSKDMVLVYRVQEEDMQFVPGGRFQVPFSITPQPLKVGDYLVTRYPKEDAIYMSRNADQIFFSRENLEVHYVFASPLNYDPLSVDAELEGLRTSGAIVRLTCAKNENLTLLKKAWCGSAPAVLHISCHTAAGASAEQAHVVLEEDSGCGHQVPASSFLDLIIGGGPAPEVVVVSSCSSETWASMFLDRGVRRVVAVRDRASLLDRAASHFAFSFYGELRSHHSVETAFKIAVEGMRTSREPGVPAEADKLILLKDGSSHELHLGFKGGASMQATELEPYVAVPLPFGAGDAGHVGPLVYPHSVVPGRGGDGVVPDAIPLSRREFMIKTFAAFTKIRVLKVCGPPGMGKAHFAGLLAGFAALPGGRLFSGGVIVVDRNVDGGVLSQETMCKRFLPIIKDKGTLVRKGGSRLARPAKKDEEVLTMINGEVVARVVVQDDTSMVIQQQSTDHELYVLDQQKFEQNYEMPGTDITEVGGEFDTLRERGFKHYERKGMLMIYRVTEEDMKLVPGCKFEVSFSTIPQPVRVGDYLVTGYPDCQEVYMSRNAEQIYSSQIIRSQEEMRKNFIPQLVKKGTLMKRIGSWLARPARLQEEIVTIINGEVMAKTVVTDDSSMVVATESCDGEWYVLSDRDFDRSYETPGHDITEAGERFDTWRSRGFKWFQRKGMVRTYKVTRKDLEFLPGGRFWGKSGRDPQRLQVGDHLVADYPNMEEIYMCRNAEQVFDTVPLSDIIRSQLEMIEHFIPIMKAQGQVMARTGVRAARPARRGEKIRTLIDGEVVAKVDIIDDSSMVIQKDTIDRELVALSFEKFQRFYVADPMEIEADGLEFDALRARGYKHFRRKGKVLVYRVVQEDMAFVPGGAFYSNFSNTPQPLRVGDHLVAPYPHCNEIFLNRNAAQCYDPIDDDDAMSVLTSSSFRGTPRPAPGASPRDASFVSRLRAAVKTHGISDGVDPLNHTLSAPARPVDPGMRARAELEDAVCTAASRQAAAASRWYASLNAVSRKPRGAEHTEAEMAVDKWMTAIPLYPRLRNGRALLVLVDGAKYLAHEASRDLLRRLLRNNPGLSLLVTVTTPPRKGVDNAEAAAARAAMMDAPPPLDPQICELPNMVPLCKLSDREVAGVFFSAMMRSQQGRPLGRLLAQLGRRESVARLEQHPVIRVCEGIPGAALRQAELIDSTVMTLEQLRPCSLDAPVASP